jgi:hypothetical protein
MWWYCWRLIGLLNERVKKILEAVRFNLNGILRSRNADAPVAALNDGFEKWVGCGVKSSLFIVIHSEACGLSVA